MLFFLLHSNTHLVYSSNFVGKYISNLFYYVKLRIKTSALFCTANWKIFHQKQKHTVTIFTNQFDIYILILERITSTRYLAIYLHVWQHTINFLFFRFANSMAANTNETLKKKWIEQWARKNPKHFIYTNEFSCQKLSTYDQNLFHPHENETN